MTMNDTFAWRDTGLGGCKLDAGFRVWLDRRGGEVRRRRWASGRFGRHAWLVDPVGGAA